MGFEGMIASRYLKTKRHHPFVGVISSISVLGIAVGVAALIVVLAVMNGFDEDLKSRIIGIYSHLVIEREGAFKDYEEQTLRLSQERDIEAVAPYIQRQALVQVKGQSMGVLLRGIDPQRESRVSDFLSYIETGSPPHEGVLIGSVLARRLNVVIGDRLSFLTGIKQKPSFLKVEGIFNSGVYEYDQNLAVVNLTKAQELYLMKDEASGLSARVKDPQKALAVKHRLSGHWRYPFYIRTWSEMNRSLFEALKLEKTVMFVILALIVLVGCFNIIGTLTLLVMDKTKEIGILKALGAGSFSIVRVFIRLGLSLGVLGTLVGGFTGAGLCLLLSRYPIIKLPPDVYYVDRLPVRMNFADMGTIVASALLLSFISTLYPAVFASRLQAVKALRYE